MLNEEIGSQVHSVNSMDLPPARTQTGDKTVGEIIFQIVMVFIYIYLSPLLPYSTEEKHHFSIFLKVHVRMPILKPKNQ